MAMVMAAKFGIAPRSSAVAVLGAISHAEDASRMDTAVVISRPQITDAMNELHT